MSSSDEKTDKKEIKLIEKYYSKDHSMDCWSLCEISENTFASG